jgi:uncharacterized membrane protein
LTDPGNEVEAGAEAAPAAPEDAAQHDPGALRAAVLQMERHEFSGPLPPPEVLARYNEALPGGAERIVALAEQQPGHRRRMEARGQVLLFAVVLIALVGGIGLIALGENAAGLVPVIAAIGGLGSLFVYREVKTHRLTKQLEAE